MKKALKVITGILFALLFIVLALVVVMRFMGVDASFFGYNMYYVVTGSMEPEISAGDIIIGKKAEPEEFGVGDVIIYKGTEGALSGKVITHKIIEITNTPEGMEFITKGTANDIEDPPVSEEQIIAKMTAKLPFLGKIFSLVNSKWGFFAVIILPIAFLLVHETAALVKAIKDDGEEVEQSEAQEKKSKRK